jgi:prepilin-type N-terminal cleavage/methylation domain-containing protein
VSLLGVKKWCSESQKGLTITELLISMSIAALALAGLCRLVAGGLFSYQEVSTTFYEDLSLRSRFIQRLTSDSCKKERLSSRYLIHTCSEGEAERLFYLSLDE